MRAPLPAMLPRLVQRSAELPCLAGCQHTKLQPLAAGAKAVRRKLYLQVAPQTVLAFTTHTRSLLTLSTQKKVGRNWIWVATYPEALLTAAREVVTLKYEALLNLRGC